MSGIDLITKERQRQIEEEGWTPDHDDEHGDGELLAAAICYAHNSGQFKFTSPRAWPWAESWWKPTGDRVRDLAKAGALIAAEIDRLERAKEQS
ncbi:MAG TPA: hypothetical protein VJS44_14070 [Pyrinomonadaceae bacterium]|nr:hypothetical protein [Pyrinomonadaceae bacterium]